MRTALECLAMAARMDGYASRAPSSALRGEWSSMALYWRALARQADWQDGLEAQSP